MTIGYGDLKKGMAIDLDGEPYVVVEYERSKMQQRAPTSRVRFRSIKTGRVVDRSFIGFNVKFTPAAVERRTSQYIYREDELYYFMDQKTFEQFPLSVIQLGDDIKYLVEQIEVEIILHDEVPIAIELPITVDMKITETGPSFKGDTAQGGTKPATLETGLVINVPLFIDVEDIVKVDTRSADYISRV